MAGDTYTIAGLSPNISGNDPWVYGGPSEYAGFSVNPDITIGLNAARYTYGTPTLVDPTGHYGDYQFYAVNFNGPVSSIPEPATWAMMLVGFAGLGFAALSSGEGRHEIFRRGVIADLSEVLSDCREAVFLLPASHSLPRNLRGPATWPQTPPGVDRIEKAGRGFERGRAGGHRLVDCLDDIGAAAPEPETGSRSGPALAYAFPRAFTGAGKRYPALASLAAAVASAATSPATSPPTGGSRSTTQGSSAIIRSWIRGAAPPAERRPSGHNLTHGSRLDGPESVYCGRSGPRPWTHPLGGQRTFDFAGRCGFMGIHSSGIPALRRTSNAGCRIGLRPLKNLMLSLG